MSGNPRRRTGVPSVGPGNGLTQEHYKDNTPKAQALDAIQKCRTDQACAARPQTSPLICRRRQKLLSGGDVTPGVQHGRRER
jgi:hypothetical protein